MAQPYLGEIRIFAGNFAPAGWMFCEGQLLAISENETLFSLIGNLYGGDGQNTFALPDLRGRIPLCQGPGLSQNYVLAEAAGVEKVTLTTQQMPTHNHPLLATGDPSSATTASGNITAANNQLKIYKEGSVSKTFAPNAIAPAGGSQSHTNFQPYLCVNFIISLFGIYPSPKGSAIKDSPLPFVAEIRIFPFNFAPKGWARCDGQMLSVPQNTELFSLLGAAYGGDGKATFALPDMVKSAPMHPGQGPGLSLHTLGEVGGAQNVTLLPTEMPFHNHGMRGDSTASDLTSPTNNTCYSQSTSSAYMTNSSANLVQMRPQMLSLSGGRLPHNNMQPYLTLNFCIALQGVYPPRS